MAEYLDKTGLAYFWKKAKAKIYPVGSIYMSVYSTSPASLFGGTWEQINDKFLFSTGKYSAGSTGGEFEHALDKLEMPTHRHDTGFYQTREEIGSDAGQLAESGVGFSGRVLVSTLATSTPYHDSPKYIGPSGGGNPHNNMPPYLTVYMWKRIA